MPIPPERITELHYISHVKHIQSILKRGILSHAKAARYVVVSIADPEVQELRALRAVPQGLPLHQYANLYFDARNPMMYVRREGHLDICVLRVSPEVLSIPGVVISDGNAAAGNTAFHPSPAGLQYLEEESVFAEWWNDPDYFTKRENRRKRCAEVLVPQLVHPKYVSGAYVSSAEAEVTVRRLTPNLPITVRPYLFFR